MTDNQKSAGVLHSFTDFQGMQKFLPMASQLQPNDSVLLMGDAIYQLVSGAEFGERSYGLTIDALARGIDPEQFNQVTWLDDAGWVDLVVAHRATVSW